MIDQQVEVVEGVRAPSTLYRVVAHHTYPGEFTLSSGAQSKWYVDMCDALLCETCGDKLVRWYVHHITHTKTAPEPWLPIVATGTFGATLLGSLRAHRVGEEQLVLWNPKGHGREWSGKLPLPGSEVVLVDDIVSSGKTLRALVQACEGFNWRVLTSLVPVTRDA